MINPLENENRNLFDAFRIKNVPQSFIFVGIIIKKNFGLLECFYLMKSATPLDCLSIYFLIYRASWPSG